MSLILEIVNSIFITGEFQIEVDIHGDVNKKIGKIERPDISALQETCLESSREDQSGMVHNEEFNTW